MVKSRVIARLRGGTHFQLKVNEILHFTFYLKRAFSQNLFTILAKDLQKVRKIHCCYE